MSELITPVENIPPFPTDGNEENKKRVRGSKSKLRTRCYYTDYVNHAIRFFLSTPETLKMDGKRRADIENWIAVQAVFHCLKDEDRAILVNLTPATYTGVASKLAELELN